MENQPVFKKVAFGGFDKVSVLDYVFELSTSTQEAQEKLAAQLEEVAAAREKLAASLQEAEAGLSATRAERDNLSAELSGERSRSGELGALIESLHQEVAKQERIVAEKDEEIAAYIRKTRELADRNTELESKKEEVDRASVYIGELLLRTRADSEKILSDASRQAEEMVADASRSLDEVYGQFKRFRSDMEHIQEQIQGSLSAVQEKFSDMNRSVEQAEYTLRDFCNAPATELKLVTDAGGLAYTPFGDEQGENTTFFRPAAEN